MKEWIKTTDSVPLENEKVIIAYLNRFSNARWKWSLRAAQYSRTRFLDSGHHRTLNMPDYWMSFPSEPEMTEDECKQSEKCFASEKAKEIKKARENLIKLEKEII